jgi:hypothetical protein
MCGRITPWIDPIFPIFQGPVTQVILWGGRLTFKDLRFYMAGNIRLRSTTVKLFAASVLDFANLTRASRGWLFSVSR